MSSSVGLKGKSFYGGNCSASFSNLEQSQRTWPSNRMQKFYTAVFSHAVLFSLLKRERRPGSQAKSTLALLHCN